MNIFLTVLAVFAAGFSCLIARDADLVNTPTAVTIFVVFAVVYFASPLLTRKNTAPMTSGNAR
jgi:hypothetical protein